MKIEADAAKALVQQGWQIVQPHVVVAGVQIDLLARDPKNVLTLVEVKSKSALSHLSYRQRSRLLRAARVLAEFEPVQLVLVQMSAQEAVLIPVDALTD